MKKIKAEIILAIALFSSSLSAQSASGPVIKGFYAPKGAGSYAVPYDRSINGGSDSGLTSGSADSDDTRLNSLRGYSVSCGYFYDWLQGDITYTRINTEQQYVEKASTPDGRYYADAVLWNADIKAGYRFSNPGDTSYKWLYLGIRKTNLDIEFNDTEVNATGMLAGFYGFSSTGLSGPFEFVFSYDIHAAGYRYYWNKLHSDVNIGINRKVSVDFGLSVGAGIQYEPWDLAVMIKAAPFISYKKYKEEDTGNDRDTAASLAGTIIGIEVVFSIPDYKYNITD